MLIQSFMAVCGRSTVIVMPVIIMLHLWLIGIFSVFIAKLYLRSKNPSHQGFADLLIQIKWWSLIGLSLLAIALLFGFYCGYSPISLIVFIVPFCILLVAHHFISRQRRELFWGFVPLLLSIAPVFIYQKLAPSVFLLGTVVVLYLACNLFYYLSTQQRFESNFRWLTTLFLTINLLFLEIVSGLL